MKNRINKTEDFSKEIFEKFYDCKDKILEITLHDGRVLKGKFVGYYHGEEDLIEPFIIKWHFINEDQISSFPLAYIQPDREIGLYINQSEIKSVKFRQFH